MHITLTPMRHDTPVVLERHGDSLTVNGTALDFSPLPEGATLPRDAVECEWLVGDVTRMDGVLHLTLILPHGADAPEETRFPARILLTEDGPVKLPHYDLLSPTADGTAEEARHAD